MVILSCLGFPFALVPNIDILGVKFDSRLTLEDYVLGIVSRGTQRIGILMLVKRVFVDTSVLLRCCYAFNNSFTSFCLRSRSWRTNLSIHFQPSRPTTI